MWLIKKEIRIPKIVIFSFLFFFATICFATDETETTHSVSKGEDSVKTFKINPLPPPAKSPEPSAESQASLEDEEKDAPDSKQLREIVFVLDNSGSMKKNDPNRITKEVVTGFIKNLNLGSRLGMVIFDTEAQVLQPLTEITDTAGDDPFIASLSRLDYQGQQTNTPMGIERAIYELKTSGNADADKMIILLTDGIIDTGDVNRDAESERWLKEDLTSQCRDLGIKIFGIAFTDKADFRLMQMLASKTDGEYFRVYKPEGIQSVFDTINDRLNKLNAEKMASSKPGAVPLDSGSGQSPTTVAGSMEPSQTQQQGNADDHSATPKLPTLRTKPSSVQQSVPEPAASPKTMWDTLLTLFLIAVIIIVLILLLMMFRGSPAKMGHPVQGSEKAPSPAQHRPDVQAELIDVEHIIPQDSISLTIDKASVSIGRDPHNDIVIPEKVVSSLHATITYRNGQYYLEDNRSTNGTRLNNNVVDQNTKIKLKSGDIIHFAKCEFRFLVHDQAPYGETMLIEAD